jgi:hypothetical protein
MGSLSFSPCQARPCEASGRGTSGAHHHEICREMLRTTEISGAGQVGVGAYLPTSGALKHKTRPTGRLTPCAIR